MATNLNAIQYVNPINLGGNEILNSLMEKSSTAPINPIAGRMYYNTLLNTAMFYNGNSWVNMGATGGSVQVVVNETYTTLADYITNVYNPDDFNEGDLLVLSSSTDPSQRVWINLGTNNGDATDFTAMSNAYDETEIKAFFSVGTGLDYSNGQFSISNSGVDTLQLADDSVTKDKINLDVAGAGLGQNIDGSLEVKVDDAYIHITNDTLTFDSEALGTTLAGAGLELNGSTLDVVVDQTSIEILGDVVRVADGGITTEKVADNSITKDKIASDVAGNGIGQNVDGSLEVKVDGASIKIIGDTLTVDGDVVGTALAGNGIVKNGTTLDVNVDTTTIEIIGDTVQVKDGGITEAKLSTDVQAKLDRNGIAFSLAAAGVTGVSYSNGAYTIQHNFNTRSIALVLRDKANSYRQVPISNDAPTLNTARVYFSEQPADNQYEVTIIPMVF